MISKQRVGISSTIDHPTAQALTEINRAFDQMVTQINGPQDQHRYTGNTFANLPSAPIAGTVRFVTDSTVTTFGATITGGGTNQVLAFFNGTNWTVQGA